MKQFLSNIQTRKKLYILGALMLAVIIGLTGTYAWIFSQRSLQTLTEVATPSTLSITGGHADSITEIDLGNVDLTVESRSKYFIFCVTGTTNKPYNIELIHTTNIPFTYTIAKATETTDKGQIFYHANDGKTYYYERGSNQNGAYLNMDAGNKIANHDKHTATYGEYAEVQKNAEPLYWLSEDIDPTRKSGTEKFMDYYILELKWNEDLTNLKETDLIYLLAETALTSET